MKTLLVFLIAVTLARKCLRPPGWMACIGCAWIRTQLVLESILEFLQRTGSRTALC